MKTLVVTNPHDYALLIREYPKWFDMSGIETVFVTDFILRKLKEKGITPTTIEGKFAYHDPCTLNKLVVEADSPRELVAMVPGAEIVDVAPARWRYCSATATVHIASSTRTSPTASVRSAAGRRRPGRRHDPGSLSALQGPVH